MKKKILSLFVALTMVLSMVTSLSFAAESTTSYDTAFEKTENYITKGLENPDYGDEWIIIGLARSGADVPAATYTTYYNHVASAVKENGGVLSKNKYTEYSRLILALTAIGKDPASVGGYNLLKKLADFESVTKQGINGSIWALIALDSGNYTIPKVSTVNVQTTRELLIKEILDKELAGGGFALSGSEADVDITAMALSALSSYMDREDVQAAVNRGLTTLSLLQQEDGSYTSYGTTNSESCSQVIVALTALGINPNTDSRFSKNGNSVIDGLLNFYVSSGGFRHVNTSTGGFTPSVNAMATEQAYYALTAYDRYENSKNSLFDMSDVKAPKVTISSLVSSKTKQLTVKWKKVSSAAGYQIRYSTSSKFSTSSAVTVKKGTLTKTVKNLKKGKTYYVKVRAYTVNADGKKVYGSYSTVKKIKVK